MSSLDYWVGLVIFIGVGLSLGIDIAGAIKYTDMNFTSKVFIILL